MQQRLAQDRQEEPIFERDMTGQSPAFIRGYNEALDEFGALRITRLGNQLSTMTAECKALRRETEQGDPQRDRREGRRARVHDLYYGKRYRNPEFDLEVEIRRISDNERFIGVRCRIAYWAQGYRSHTNTTNVVSSEPQVNDKPSTPAIGNAFDVTERRRSRRQPVRQSRGTRR